MKLHKYSIKIQKAFMLKSLLETYCAKNEYTLDDIIYLNNEGGVYLCTPKIEDGLDYWGARINILFLEFTPPERKLIIQHNTWVYMHLPEFKD